MNRKGDVMDSKLVVIILTIVALLAIIAITYAIKGRFFSDIIAMFKFF